MTSPLWLGDGRDEWLKEVSDWLVDVVSSLGLGSVVEIVSVRERLWGAVLRVRTSDRVVYFKAEGLGAHHEPQILGELAPAWPDLVPEVLEADGPRSWLLMADHGEPMWDVLDTAGQVAALERLLPRYAQLQASSSRSVGVWIEAGAPDRRVHRLPELLDALLAGETPAGSLPLDGEQRRAAQALLGDFGRACEELAATPVAEVLDHGDLHGGNVLINGSEARLADWGDSCVGHPFTSLFVTFELAVSRFGSADRGRAGRRLRDAYLDAWSGAGSSRATGRETFTPGPLGRARVASAGVRPHAGGRHAGPDRTVAGAHRRVSPPLAGGACPTQPRRRVPARHPAVRTSHGLGGAPSARADRSMACADQRRTRTASSLDRPATSVSHASASIPVALLTATASR